MSSKMRLRCRPGNRIERLRKVLNTLREMQERSELCDSVLRTASGEPIKVHRAIVATCSNYFNALFTTPLYPVCRTDITIPGINRNTLELILKYAYSYQPLVQEENIYKLLPAADQFNVLELLKDCCRYLSDKMTDTNCIGIRDFARRYGCKELEEEAHNYLLYNFEDVYKTSDEMLHLSVNEMVQILSDDRLNVNSELIVWKALLTWMNYDFLARREYMPLLLGCVRLGLLEDRNAIELIMYNTTVQGNRACDKYFEMRKNFFRKIGRLEECSNELLTPPFAMPRIPHDILFVYGGWSEGNPSGIMEAYDIRSDRWRIVDTADPAGPRAYHKLAVIGYDIYVIGGFNGSQYFNSCRCFNVVNKTWREIAPMNSKRCYVSVAILNGCIYAIGGHDGYTRQSSAERYHPASNQWTCIPPMHSKRSDASAATVNGRIYVVGGFTGTSVLSSAEFYDPCWDTWTRIAPMTSPRSGLSCVTFDNSIYALGGFNGNLRLRTVEKFCFESNRWIRMPSMHDGRSNFTAEVLEDQIFVMGGYNGGTTISDVECYNKNTQTWNKATDMLIHRSALAGCVVRQVPNASEYTYQHRELLLEEKRLRARLARGVVVMGNDDDTDEQRTPPPFGIQQGQFVQPPPHGEAEVLFGANIFVNLFADH